MIILIKLTDLFESVDYTFVRDKRGAIMPSEQILERVHRLGRELCSDLKTEIPVATFS